MGHDQKIYKKVFSLFLGSPCRETPKNAIKKFEKRNKKRKKSWVGAFFKGLSGKCALLLGLFFFRRPSPPAPAGYMRHELWAVEVQRSCWPHPARWLWVLPVSPYTAASHISPPTTVLSHPVAMFHCRGLWPLCRRAGCFVDSRGRREEGVLESKLGAAFFWSGCVSHRVAVWATSKLSLE